MRAPQAPSTESGRSYRELETLLRAYLSPDVAAALLADPGRAELGGSLAEVTVLFADLQGFTAFSEGVEPAEIVVMLHRYHAVAVPCVLDQGRTVVQFVGDALLAVWGAPVRRADHAARAVRAALAMRRAAAQIADERPDWPRFRIGVNTGPAWVGNIGSEAVVQLVPTREPTDQGPAVAVTVEVRASRSCTRKAITREPARVHGRWLGRSARVGMVGPGQPGRESVCSVVRMGCIPRSAAAASSSSAPSPI